MRYGYARVSSRDQAAALQQQREALQDAGCGEIVEEIESGAKRARPALNGLLERLKEGDVVTVVKLDRLGRDTKDLLTIVDQIRKTGARFESIAEDWTQRGDSSEAQFMLTVFAGLAEFERARLKDRQKAGIARARTNKERRADGRLKYAGRKPSINATRVLKLRGEGRGYGEIAKLIGCSKTSVVRICKADAQ